MKLNKKIVCVFTFIFLMLTYCVPVFAAPVDDLKSSLINLGVPQDQVGNVIEYIQKTDISNDKFQTIQKDIDAAIVSLNGTKDLTSLDDAAAAKVEQNITNGFKELGLTSVFTTNDQTGDVTLVVNDSNGTELLTMDSLTANNILTNFDATKITDAVNLSKQVVDNSTTPTKPTTPTTPAKPSTPTKPSTSNGSTFQPTTGTEMRQTGTNYENFIIIGVFLLIISGICVSVNRKLEKC